MKKIKIGSGAGYSGDRLEPAIDLIERGELDYIIFECLAERTIAIAQEEKLSNPSKGYNPLFEYRMKEVIPKAFNNKVKVITNMGAANPIAALKKAVEISKENNLKGIKIAAVLGDDIGTDINKYLNYEILEFKKNLKSIEDKIVSANVYVGADGIVEALEKGADIVITGRVSDPALVIGPLKYEFNWKSNDLLGTAIMTGHLLECAAQVTGGYFADPGYKDVSDLWNIGFPIAEISNTGEVIITKLENTGGIVNLQTCKEQLIYEIHNPAEYITPDGIADYTEITMEQVGNDRVKIIGAKGKGEPKNLKVSIGYKDCFIGEGEISYGGSGALNRAKLSEEILKKRFELLNLDIEEIMFNYIGVNSLYGDKLNQLKQDEFNEVRLRVSCRTKTFESAKKIGEEVEALYTCGPAGGGGVTQSARAVMSIASIFIPREDVSYEVILEEIN